MTMTTITMKNLRSNGVGCVSHLYPWDMYLDRKTRDMKRKENVTEKKDVSSILQFLQKDSCDICLVITLQNKLKRNKTKRIGEAGYRSQCLFVANEALYHLSYIPITWPLRKQKTYTKFSNHTYAMNSYITS